MKKIITTYVLPMIGVAIAGLIFFHALRLPFGGNQQASTPEIPARDQIDEQSYELGFANGYKSAQEEADAAYQRGYDNARQEIGRGAFTTYGIFGVVCGFLVSSGSVIAIRRKEVAAALRNLRERYLLKKAFRTIPPDLPPDVHAIARQIAQTYVIVQQQLRSGNGYLFTVYAKKWQGKIQALMQHAVHLMELIQQLEATRAHVDVNDLSSTMRKLKRAIQNPNNDDAARNAAARSLQRAKQTQQDLAVTRKNLDQCVTSLRGLHSTLNSMHVKISNLHVNAQQTEMLDQLSSDLETEVSALEETLSDLFPQKT